MCYFYSAAYSCPLFYGPRKTVLKETCPHVMLLAFLTSQLLKPIFDWIFFLREDNLLSHGLKCVTAITALLIDVKMFSELWYWDKKAKPTWTLLCSQGSQRRGAVHMFLSLLSTSWFFFKSESESEKKWSPLNVAVMIIEELESHFPSTECLQHGATSPWDNFECNYILSQMNEKATII